MWACVCACVCEFVSVSIYVCVCGYACLWGEVPLCASVCVHVCLCVCEPLIDAVILVSFSGNLAQRDERWTKILDVQTRKALSNKIGRDCEERLTTGKDFCFNYFSRALANKYTFFL